MLGFLARGWDVRILIGERRGSAGVARRFLPLLRRCVQVEPVLTIHLRDLRYLDATRPGRVDAFLLLVAAHTGRSAAELREDLLVLRACTFTRLVEAMRADYIQSWFCYDQSFMAMFAAQVLGIPRGLSCHVDHVLADFPLKLVPLQLQTADLILAISERTRSELLQLGGERCADRILVKRIGVDSAALRCRREARAWQAPFELLSVSRIEPKKGLFVLLHALALLRERKVPVHASIVGGVDHGHHSSAAYHAELLQQVERAQLTEMVTLTGPLAHDRVAERMSRAWLFVAPYIELADGDKDGIPTAMVEAMACGLPIVCTDAGSMREAVTHEVHGLVVPQRDACALADAIQRLVADSALHARLAVSSGARFDKEYESNKVDWALQARILELLGKRKSL